MDLTSIVQSGVLVLGLTEVLKRLLPKKLKPKLAPLLAVLLGTGLYVYLYGYSPDNVVYGAVIGLSTTGIYKMIPQGYSETSSLPSTSEITIAKTRPKR